MKKISKSTKAVAKMVKAIGKAVKNEPKTIFEYIRRRKGGRVIKVGMLVGFIHDNKIKVGWSKCNLMKDKFIQSTGFNMAVDRACGVNQTPTPKCIERQVRAFGARAVRYYKGVNTLVLP